MSDPAASAAPFFILGCPRSGTTLLRDLLRQHPALACPEETHFFRWPEPFGSGSYASRLIDNDVLRRHRELDGIDEQSFGELLRASASKADFCRAYMARFMAGRKPGARRWFDKTPQNVYGAALIAASMPEARFVHIVRHPVEVVASLRLGKVIQVRSLIGACNYWNEALEILSILRMAVPDRVHELRYEDLVSSPVERLAELLAFVGEDFLPEHFTLPDMRPSSHHGDPVLSEAERARVVRRCWEGMQRHGYTAEGWLP